MKRITISLISLLEFFIMKAARPHVRTRAYYIKAMRNAPHDPHARQSWHREAARRADIRTRPHKARTH